ncbi:MAG TPA: prolyl oligopeptidase family serine peptidase [Gemmataceae bacterium]|nr:prolyl oligopeptidase family serine peptidase [Gemmataceae bacterium]
MAAMNRHFYAPPKWFCLAAAILLKLSAPAWPQNAPIEFREGLVVGAGPGLGRSALPVDVVPDLVAGLAATPRPGDKLALPVGRTAQWTAVKATADGSFSNRGPGGGYFLFTFTLEKPATMLLEASGDSAAYINGRVRAGDPYGYGYLRLPVALNVGENRLLLAGGRGKLKVRILPVRSPAMLDTPDATLPDVLTNDRGALLGAVVLINATAHPLDGLRLIARAAGASDAESTDVPSVAPLTIRKIPFSFRVPSVLSADKLDVRLELQKPGADPGAPALDTATVTLRVRKPDEVYKRTFVSRIDGSVQYYAVNPSRKPSNDNLLVLSLHGAGVEALGQAQAYGGKDWATLVAPTNRRPYGFDWEDVGRLDALEVLDIAEKTVPHDPRRVVLTGHSMGGHGTWHVGLTFPDRFAAIGPSAGWSSFSSYVNRRGATTRPASPADAMFRRAVAASDTLSLIRNSLWEDVYILHGDADDNVPVREARLMRDALAPFNHRLTYHEQKGAGHWWGSPCVDWPPMFDMFAKARLPIPGDLNAVEFVTANPAASGRCYWATIEQQIQPLRPSSINLNRDSNRVSGSTVNLAMLTLDPAMMGVAVRQVDLDGQNVLIPHDRKASDMLVLARRDGSWSLAHGLDPAQKSSHRGGPFKQAFANRMMLVYGTAGAAAENAAAYDAARYFSEALDYRGNGAVDIVADANFDATATADRNVILFGNADTNLAWPKLLASCPIRVNRGSVQVGDRRLAGSDLGVLVVYPRSGSDVALVAAVSGAGPAAMSRVGRLPLLTSGIGYPDWCVITLADRPDAAPAARAAGFFANDWSIAPDDSVFVAANRNEN